MRSVVVVGLLVGCASGPAGEVRYQNSSPVWLVDDRRSIPKPEARDAGGAPDDFDALLRRPLLDAFGVSPRPLAWNVNALGGVPDSSWFQNRIGVRRLSAAEIARGPGGSGPSREGPWSVTELEMFGPVLRLLIEDARGDRYFIKLDFLSHPEGESGADVVTQRLLWAAGYNVPEDHVVYFRPEDLRVGDDAEQVDGEGNEVPLTAASLQRIVHAMRKAAADGVHVRALASKYLPGEPVGGYAMSGIRPDDANDLVPHQHRRDVRGLRVFFSWLGTTDVKENNTLDMWMPSARYPGRGHLVHYLIDFGKSLGNWGFHDEHAHEHDGFTPHIHYGYGLRSLLSFGLWKRPWEAIPQPPYRGVGRFESVRYRPDLYAPANPYEPFFYTDREDGFWAAQIIARFRPEHVRAAVQEAKYSDRYTRAYLVRTLLERRAKLLRYFLDRVTALSHFRVDAAGGALRVCAVDLLISERLAHAYDTRYAVTAYDFEGDALDFERELAAGPDGELCVSGLPQPSAHDGYTVLAIAALRAGSPRQPVRVHLAREPATGTPRVIGLQWR